MTDLKKGLEAIDSKDYKTAIRIIKPLAEGGDGEAQGILGSMFEEGSGVPQNYDEMIKWYESSAQKGIAQSQFKLGEIFLHGAAIETDIIRAHMWANLAASNGLEEAEELRKTIECSEEMGMSRDDILKAQNDTLELLKEHPDASNLPTIIPQYPPKK